MIPASRYDDAFRAECASEYSRVTEFELSCGYAVSADRLRFAARVLACPVKVNPPNWQHGRVLYAAARKLLAADESAGMFLDIGTAKGFSATVMTWAIADAGADFPVWSVDIVDPYERVCRNSVAETVDYHQLPTVPELVAPFQDTKVSLRFFGHGSEWLLKQLMRMDQRIKFAFVDGKHSFEAVSIEMSHLVKLQRHGDVVVIDDLQIPGVKAAVDKLRGYDLSLIRVLHNRSYAVGVRQ